VLARYAASKWFVNDKITASHGENALDLICRLFAVDQEAYVVWARLSNKHHLEPPLYFAIRLVRSKVVEWLLTQANIDINTSTTSDKVTALDVAIRHGSL
jgi:ankyrin repeat protein